MRLKTVALLILPIFLIASTVFSLYVYALEERRVLSRDYVGLGVDVYAPDQCYPGENITVRVRVEALDDVKNVSVTLFVWGSKSDGNTPWGVSFTVLNVQDFPEGTVQDDTYDGEIPSDIDPGLVYGIVYLDWSIYRSDSWEPQWDKASIRLTYVKNKNYEDLQTTHSSILRELQDTKTLLNIFITITAALAVSTAYLASKRVKQND